jgi:hypothetical protein
LDSIIEKNCLPWGVKYSIDYILDCILEKNTIFQSGKFFSIVSKFYEFFRNNESLLSEDDYKNLRVRIEEIDKEWERWRKDVL